MRYLIDNNSITSSLIAESLKRDDLFIIEDVEYEYNPDNFTNKDLSRTGLKTLILTKKHYLQMSKIMSEQGLNYDLINLFKNEGSADIAILSYILGERETPDELMDILNEYTIITNDKGLRDAAILYKIKVIDTLPQT